MLHDMTTILRVSLMKICFLSHIRRLFDLCRQFWVDSGRQFWAFRVLVGFLEQLRVDL